MDPSELRHTHCGVSLLVNYEEGRSWSDWEVRPPPFPRTHTSRAIRLHTTPCPHVLGQYPRRSVQVCSTADRLFWRAPHLCCVLYYAVHGVL